MPAPATGVSLDLRGARTREVTGWGTKQAALAALAALRDAGWNLDPGIEVHRAETHLWRFWVVGRPDHFNGVTYLMTDAGAWVAGRLTDASPCWHATPCRGGHLAPWKRLDRPIEPATFEHVTRTVPDSANRRERHRTKSNGSCGRWVITDDSVAVCVCGWKRWESTRAEARLAARHHREEMSTAATATVGGAR